MKSAPIFITTSLHRLAVQTNDARITSCKTSDFFILCAAKRYEEFKSICQSEDTVVTLEQVYSKIPQKNSEPIVYEIARKNEAKYKIKYMRDIIQLCPIYLPLSWVMWITMYTVQKN